MNVSKKLAFIGCGNMGGAILDGILSTKLMKKEEILVCVQSDASLKRIKQEKDVDTTRDLQQVKEASMILLAVKPNRFEEVISEIKEIAKDKLIISVAAGITMDQISSYFDNETLKVIRVMPNTPACVQEAMSSLSVNSHVSDEEKEAVKSIFTSFGKVIEVKEKLIHAVIAMSGSSPAYVFMLLDAMIQKGMNYGLNKEQAYELASQAVLGSAKMVRDLKIDPDQLKKNVCSPNGTTIEAVQSFERDDFYEIIQRAMDACYHRSKEMSEN